LLMGVVLFSAVCVQAVMNVKANTNTKVRKLFLILVSLLFGEAF
jgi:hypothetical protein